MEKISDILQLYLNQAQDVSVALLSQKIEVLRSKSMVWIPFSLKPMRCRTLGCFWPQPGSLDPNAMPEIEYIQSAFPKLMKLSDSKNELGFGKCTLEDLISTPSNLKKTAPPASEDVVPDFIFVPALACDMHGAFLGRDDLLYRQFMRTIRCSPNARRVVLCGVVHSDFLVDKIPSRFLIDKTESLDCLVTDQQFYDFTGNYEDGNRETYIETLASSVKDRWSI